MPTIIHDKKVGGFNSITVCGTKNELDKVADYAKSLCMQDSSDKPTKDKKHDAVNSPLHYCSNGIETIKKIEAVVNGLPAEQAYILGNVIKYVDRAGLKDDAKQDLAKANTYAHRLVTGEWRNDNQHNN